MRVALVCPAPPGSRSGNRITALRWRRMLRELGHEAEIVTELGRRGHDLVVALHALRSAEAVRASRERHPERPVIVALTGTDLYRDIHHDDAAKRSIELADRLIVLHPDGAQELPRELRPKARVIPQSAEPPTRAPRRSTRRFDVAVVGHLRPEKDPFRTALASRLLPAASRVRVLHAGRALSAPMRAAAEAEQRTNARYRWLGELARWQARALIARCHVLVLSSRMEGGANVLSEAIAAGTPIVASRIACTEAILGVDYPGLFPLASTRSLARLLQRAEQDPGFLAELARRCRARRSMLSPRRERDAWKSLIREIGDERRRGERPDPPKNRPGPVTLPRARVYPGRRRA